MFRMRQYILIGRGSFNKNRQLYFFETLLRKHFCKQYHILSGIRSSYVDIA